jgi:hypothetical protein
MPPQPPSVARQFSFTDHSTNNPTTPQPGDRLDGEFDRTNANLNAVSAWTGTSLNTDGSIRAATVGQAQLVPGLFDFIADDAKAEVQPLVDQAEAYSISALGSANTATAAASTAATASSVAQGAAAQATGSASTAFSAQIQAQASANTADTRATDSSNSANLSRQSENSCINYGVLTQAWAEHMPDTIPPNILAWMGVTGDHWSSRWWANRANEIVDDGIEQTVCAVQQFWMGAYAGDPVLDLCGRPPVAGAAYFNTSFLRTRVYDGAIWHDIVEPIPGVIQAYVYLPTIPTQIFTGPDSRGNALVLDPTAVEVGVYLNGVRLIDTTDYTLAQDAVSLSLGTISTPNVLEIVVIQEPAASPIPRIGQKVDTSVWVFDGVARTFPLADGVGGTLNPAGPSDCQLQLNGTMQEPGVDFSTAAGTVTFAIAPQADADRWMICGIAAGATPPAGASIPHTPTPPTAPIHASLWSRTDGCLFIWDGLLGAWIQMSGYAA